MSDIDPLTIASIDLGGGFQWSPIQRPVVTAHCGCECRTNTGRISLCSYHEGFEDGVEAARRAQDDEKEVGDD